MFKSNYMFIWIGFIIFVFFFLAFDLGVFNCNFYVIIMCEVLGWIMLWVSLFLLFSVFIYYVYGNGWIVNLEFFIVRDVVFKYLIGYLVE